MKSIICSLLLSILVFSPGMLQSQNDARELDRVYGLDQTLCNGKKYAYFPPSGTTGHQFLLSFLFSSGSVTLKGKCYTDVSLNYDIFNQQLLLQYADENYPLNIIEISQAWLTDFHLGNMKFELLKLEQESKFYQVLGDGPVRILYFWRKTLNLNDAIGSTNLVFSKALRDCFVFMDGQLKPYTTKRSFIRLFDPKNRPEVKSYLRKNKVKVKKASDRVMSEMITVIGNIK
jgi:hypothetical protein